jgi:hypothetical protein
VVRIPDFHRWGKKIPSPCRPGPPRHRRGHPLRGRPHHRRLIVETVVGTNGILIPPDGTCRACARSATRTASCSSRTR